MKAGKSRIILYAAGAAAVIAAIIYCGTGENSAVINKLKRPDYGDETSYSLTVEAFDGSCQVEIPVSGKRIPDEELQIYFDSAFEVIYGQMKGNNESLENVRTNLVFVEEIGEFGMKAEYTPEDYSLINCFGELSNKECAETGTECIIHVTLTYEEYSQTYDIPVIVFPPEYTEEEKFAIMVEEAVKEADAKDPQSDYISLPETVGGVEVKFVEKKGSRIGIIILIGAAAAFIWYYKKYALRKKEEKKKELQMRLDYSEIVAKLSLLMGAGMSTAAAFSKIASDYRNAGKPAKNSVRYAYEEIREAVNRLNSGVSEQEVYTDFGRKCKIHCYIKLGNLMAQNIRKGGEGFNEILKSEATEAFMERKALALKTGEEAGTKLLFPMIMMLFVVLVIIIVPAFMSF